MTIIASIDSSTSPRRIYLHADTVGVTFQPMDAYKEMRSLRASDESLRAYDVYMTSQGNEPTGPSTATPRRVRMENSVFIPFDTDHVLTVIGEVITSSGGSGVSAFDRTPLNVNTSVDINYIPPQVEILYINTGSGVTAQDKIDIAAGVWISSTRQLTVASGLTVTQEAKLDAIPTNPVLVTDSRLNYLSANASSGSASLSTLQNDKLMSLGTPTEIVTTLMETPIPAAPTANTFGDLIKNKILTIFRFNTYK